MVNELQMLTPTGWKYVFCRNIDKNIVITTEDRKAALKGNHALEFFKMHFANHVFRLVPNTVKVEGVGNVPENTMYAIMRSC